MDETRAVLRAPAPPGGSGSLRTRPRPDRAAQARLAVSVMRILLVGLQVPALLSTAVVAPLGAVVLLWVLVSATLSAVAALVVPGLRRWETVIVAGDVVAIVAVAATTDGGYYPVVLLATARMFQIPARWGLRGALVAGAPIIAAALAWPSPQKTDIHGFLPLLLTCAAITAAGWGVGRFARRVTAAHDQSELALTLTFHHSPTSTVLTDDDGVVTRVNPATVALCGVAVEDLLGRPLVTLVHPDDAGALAGVLSGEAGDEVDVRLTTVRGPHWTRLLVGRIPAAAGLPPYRVVQAEDVHERRTTAERLAHDATHDALTGLANRRAIHAELDTLLSDPVSTGALVMVDLDGFKAVNDRFGHEAGDALLVIVAERLRRAARGGDLAGRLAGDEMVLLARGVPDEAGALAVGQRVLDELMGPADVGPDTVMISASAGARWIGAQETDARQVLRDADAALYRAKDNGRGRVEAAPASGTPSTRTPAALRAAVAPTGG